MTTKQRMHSPSPSNARGSSRGRGRFALTDEHKMLDRLRDIVARTEFVVNDTLTPTQRREIHRLLRQKDPQLPYAIIAVRVSRPNNPVSANAVGYEAHAIGEKRKKGRKKGTVVGEGVGGRPPGEGKKFSPLRAPMYAMFADGKTPADVVNKFRISLTYAKRMHAEWISSKNTDENK